MQDWKALAAPFSPQEVEWRIGRSGCKKDGNVWAMCLAYITNRAIQQRLDNVIGPAEWKNEYAAGPGGGVICGISISVGDEWVTKWDGAEARDIEAVKSALSDSMKRSACQWGIGRYLYDLEEGWAEIHDNRVPGGKRAKCQGPGGDKWFYWLPPKLPSWALPGKTRPSGSPAPQASLSGVEEVSEPDPVEELNNLLMDGGCSNTDEANRVVAYLWDGTKESISEIRSDSNLVSSTVDLIKAMIKSGTPLDGLLAAALDEKEEEVEI